MNKKIQRPPTQSAVDQAATPPQSAGIGRRSLWPLPAVGEAARRNIYVPDPVPNSKGPPRSQADASPPVTRIGNYAAGGGVNYNGFPAEATYVKRIGTMVTRALARNWLAGVIDARWRVGGVSLPPDYGLGMGAGQAADATWPTNPQTFMRNPGIRPIVGLPPTYRYAPNMQPSIQPVGPSIGDVGNMVPTGR